MRAIPPLLALMDGRKARPRKAPRVRPLEIKLHVEIAKTLRRHCYPTWRWSHFPAGERRDPRTGAKLKLMGLQRGWPDFLLLSPQGLLHALEAKRPGEKLSPEQEDFRLWCTSHGVPHATVETIEAARLALRVWGAIAELREAPHGQP